MLKVMGRLLVVLTVIGLMTAGIYLLFENNPALGLSARGFDQRDGNFPGRSQGLSEDFAHRGDRSTGAFENGFEGRAFRGEHGREGGFSFIGLLGIARNLGIIAAITLVVWAISRLTGLIRRHTANKPQSGDLSIAQEMHV